MKSIKCEQCGLINWVLDGACKRCGRPLAFSEEINARAESGAEAEGAEAFVSPAAPPVDEDVSVCSFCGTQSSSILCPVCRKPLKPILSEPVETAELPRVSANLVVGVMLVAALVVACVSYLFLKRSANKALAERTQVVELVRGAGAFDAPIYISFADESAGLAPGVRALMEKGLVSYRLSTTPQMINFEEMDKETGEIVRREKENPDAGRTFARVELTARGIAEAAGWKRHDVTAGAGAGWSVPVGARRFVEVTEIGQRRALSLEEWEKLPEEARASVPHAGEVALVNFAWRWEPDQLGHYFDAHSEDHQSLSPEAQESARACRLDDSTKLRAGMAALVYENGGPVVRAVVFDPEPKK